MDIFKLYRNFWDFCFENPEKIKPNDIAIFAFAVEHCNRLGWKKKFGFPTSMVMDATGIKSYSVYKKHLDNLVECGFITMIELSKNQYSANVIALAENYKAHYKALDKAIIKHTSKQSESTSESNDSIDIPIYKDTNLPKENNTPTAFSFYKSLISIGAESKLVNEWIAVRKKKNLTNSETAFDGFVREMNKGGLNINETLRICVEKSWGGLNAKWLDNPTPTEQRSTTKVTIFG